MRATRRGLSKQGQVRRQEILNIALAESRRIGKLRRLKRTGVATAVGLAILAASIQLYRPNGQDLQPPLAKSDDRMPVNLGPPAKPDWSIQPSEAAVADVSLLQETAAHTALHVSSARRSSEIDLSEYVLRRDIEDVGDYLIRTRSDLPADLLLNDRQLLVMLASVGRPSALARTDERVFLTQ